MKTCALERTAVHTGAWRNGIRRRLKIFRLRSCGFESHRSYQSDLPGPRRNRRRKNTGPRGLEPVRWNSVEKTVLWTVFRNSPEGFSPRERAFPKGTRESHRSYQSGRTVRTESIRAPSSDGEGPILDACALLVRGRAVLSARNAVSRGAGPHPIRGGRCRTDDGKGCEL